MGVNDRLMISAEEHAPRWNRMNPLPVLQRQL